ncbi:hypothetical protein P3T20_007087 [Paraburkholderia sp. GAS206C]
MPVKDVFHPLRKMMLSATSNGGMKTCEGTRK